MQVREVVASCTGTNRDGTPCGNVAGFRTEHYGEGKCFMHGGASPRGVDSPHFKHGKRSKYRDVVRAQLREKIDALEGIDTLDIEDEALLLRALLQDILEREKGSDTDMHRVAGMIDQITRTAERMTRMRNDTAITASEVALVAARMAHIASSYIEDPDKLQRFLIEVFDTVGMKRE